MKYSISSALLYSYLILVLGVLCWGQQMPQDYWKFNGEIFDPATSGGLKGLAIDSNGRIYAGDQTQIKVWSEDGTLLDVYTGFTNVNGIAVTDSEDLFVYDTGAENRIIRVDSAGTIVSGFGVLGSGTAEFDSAFTGYIDGHAQMVAIDGNGNVVAVDPNGYRTHVFNQDGTYVTSFGSQGMFEGEYPGRPISVCSLSDGRIAVATGPSGEPGGFSVPRIVAIYNSDYSFERSIEVPSSTSAIYGGKDGLIVRAYSGGSDRYEFDVWDESDRVFAFSTGYVRDTNWRPYGIAVNPKGDILISTNEDLRWKRRTYNDADLPESPLPLPQPYISALVQRDSTTLVDIDYKVVDANSPTVDTAMVIYTGEPSLSTLLLPETLAEGTDANLGAGIASNTTHRVTWDAGVDWDTDIGTIKVEVLAKDERELFPIHWTTLPGEDGDPEIQISANPVTNADLYSLWVWLLATRSPSVSLVDGEVIGVGGGYDGQTFYDGTDTTASGRDFLLSLLNVEDYGGGIVKKLP